MRHGKERLEGDSPSQKTRLDDEKTAVFPLAVVVACFFCLATVHAQGPVEGPVSTGYYRVTRFDRIETDRDRTVAEVTFRYFPNYWIRFDSLECFLRDGDGDKTY